MNELLFPSKSPLIITYNDVAEIAKGVEKQWNDPGITTNGKKITPMKRTWGDIRMHIAFIVDRKAGTAYVKVSSAWIDIKTQSPYEWIQGRIPNEFQVVQVPGWKESVERIRP
jgi:hypothetical protein